MNLFTSSTNVYFTGDRTTPDIPEHHEMLQVTASSSKSCTSITYCWDLENHLQCDLVFGGN